MHLMMMVAISTTRKSTPRLMGSGSLSRHLRQGFVELADALVTRRRLLLHALDDDGGDLDHEEEHASPHGLRQLEPSPSPGLRRARRRSGNAPPAPSPCT